MLKEIIENSAIKFATKQIKSELKKSLNIEILDKEFLRIPQNKKYMLYAHIPFCSVFCPYCSFHKYKFEPNLCKEYFVNLRKEMVQIKDLGYDFYQMYIGGGTTLIDEYELLKTLELAKKLFSIKEISCESDPNHISNLKIFKGLIDRISVGVQSFDDEILKKVGRFEKFGNQKTLIEKLQKGIGELPIFSLDLIFNFPFQKKNELLEDIKIAKFLDPEQITFYPLMKSPLTKDLIAKSLGVSNEDNEKEFYKIICESFKDFDQNNVWSFSKKFSKLNDEYVSNNHEYLGIGSGAFSFLDGKLLINAFNLKEYGNLVKQNKSTVIAKCEFDEISRTKYIFLTEIFSKSLDIKNFDNLNLIKKEIMLLKICKAVKENGDFLETTEFGNYMFLVLMKEFYMTMDKIRAIFKTDIKNEKILKLFQ